MLRTERPGDMLPVYELVSAAFGRPDEAELVNRLRECGAAVVTMVEEEEYEFMGHLMLSPITIEGQEGPWLGLAPVAVHPDWQGRLSACQRLRPALHLRGADGVFHGDGVATRRARRGKGRGALSPPVR